MKNLGNLLAGLIVVFIILLAFKSDELLCNTGTNDVDTFYLCLELKEDCDISAEMVSNYIQGLSLMDKYCDPDS
jgi:hypothetical protein